MNDVVIACAIILSLCALQIAAFVKSKNMFRFLNQVLWIPAPTLLAAAVALNIGFLLGAAEQYLAIPGANRSVIMDPGGQPISYSVIFCLIALACLTILLRFLDQRRQRM